VSNFLAIATVTTTLGELIQTAISREVPGWVPGAKVSFYSPASKEIDRNQPAVNIYLFQTSRNAALRDADLPTRRADGSIIQRPQAAINLEYLLSFYGDERTLEAQRLAGIVIAQLHAQPQLSRALIDSTIPHYPYLATSNLARQIDLVKFSPVPLSPDDLSKLWSSLLHAEYALSIVYEGTVVLLDGPGDPEVPLPVLRPQLSAAPFREPNIARVISLEGADRPLVAGSTMAIIGTGLQGAITRVDINGYPVVPQSMTGTEIRVLLSPEQLPWLRAGVLRVQVVHLRASHKAQPLPGATSNLVPALLHPTILRLEVAAAGDIVAISATLDLTVGKDDPVLLVLNRWQSPGLSGYTFGAVVRQADSAMVSFHVTGVEPGEYLVRVQVSGVPSLLAVDRNPQSPTHGQYSSPRLSIA
jgi:hypothetical protein